MQSPTADRLRVPIRGTKFSYEIEVSRRVLSRRTEFQQIDIVDTDAFGRMLFLDGHVQLSELDEHAYHESLVQIPILSLARPSSALVIGGGDGGVLRELCRCPSMEHIDMAEIDAGVIDSSREHLPFLGQGAFDDPRVHVHVCDALEFVRASTRSYDLIVADSTDVYEDEQGALSEMLFTHSFYQDCSRILSPAGVIVTQADNLLFCPYSLDAIKSQFSSVFGKVGSYWSLVPSFGGFSGFCWGSQEGQVARSEIHITAPYRYLTPLTMQLAFSKIPFGIALPHQC